MKYNIFYIRNIFFFRIPADIKQAAFSVGLKQNSDPEIFKKLFELYTTTTSYSDRESALWALSSSRDKTQLTKFVLLLGLKKLSTCVL